MLSIGPYTISQGSGCHIVAHSAFFRCSAGICAWPVPFFFYTSPVPAIASRHGVSVKQFSDSTQEYAHFNMDPYSQSVALGSLADCPADNEDWFIDNRVKLNLRKSLLLYAVPKLHSSELVNPSLFDSALSMVSQVNSVCKCAFFPLTLIGRMRKYLDVRSVKLLVNAIVLSRIDYANSLLFVLPNTLW